LALENGSEIGNLFSFDHQAYADKKNSTFNFDDDT
jgi:hypothetical protein